MRYLQQEDYSLVLELLKKAEILTEKDAAARAATFNNFACYYRRQGKLHAALQYLQKVCIYRRMQSFLPQFNFTVSPFLFITGLEDRG